MSAPFGWHNPYPWPRTPVLGANVVCTSQPLAAQAGLSMLAAGSAAHLAAILFPQGLRRLYILRDRDPAGSAACDRLSERATSAGIETFTLSPRQWDFNEDLMHLGPAALRAWLRRQLAPEDVSRFLTPAG